VLARRSRDSSVIKEYKEAAMTRKLDKIEFDGQSFSVDAALIANSFGIGPEHVQPLMREGKITSRCERGIDQDAGRYRLTFFHGRRNLSFIVDEAGEILERCFKVTPRGGRGGSAIQL
jgi:hypothetical protein